MLCTMVLTVGYAQSENMKEVVRLMKENMVNEGFTLTEEWYLEINRYTGVGSEEQTFYSGTQYTGIIIVDECTNCYPDIFLRVDGVDYETVQETYHEADISVTVGIIIPDSDTYGLIVGLLGREAWHESCLLIFED